MILILNLGLIHGLNSLGICFQDTLTMDYLVCPHLLHLKQGITTLKILSVVAK